MAGALEAKRGRPSAGSSLDYTFSVEDDRVRIVPRKRGAPLDKLVSEMMIVANSTWGELLAERDVAAIYRVQSTGKVRFSLHAEGHEGLGVSAYAWMSSPLRRYVDLINQWQLAAAVGRTPAAFHAHFGRAAGLPARLRSDLRALRRAPARDGDLLDPALAAAGRRSRRWMPRCCARIWCASTACLWSCA